MPFNNFSVSTMAGVIEQVATNVNEVSADEEAVYTAWGNECTRDIARAFPNAPFNYVSADRTLSAGTRHYTNFPSDFDRLINVTIPEKDVKLKSLTEEEFNAIQPSATEQGIPTVYTLHGATATENTQIEFYPVPGAGYTTNYEYRKLPTTVSAISADIPVPIKYADLYIDYVQMKALRRREDYDQAAIIEARYEASKQAMLADFKRRTEEPWRIKSIREFTPDNQKYSDEIVNLFWNQDRV